MRYLLLFLVCGIMASCSGNGSKSSDNTGYDANSDEVKESNRYNNIHNLDQRAAIYRRNTRR